MKQDELEFAVQHTFEVLGDTVASRTPAACIQPTCHRLRTHLVLAQQLVFLDCPSPMLQRDLHYHDFEVGNAGN